MKKKKSFLNSLKLGGVYIPPEDSPYFQVVDMGALAAHTRHTGHVVVLGDFNARVRNVSYSRRG